MSRREFIDVYFDWLYNIVCGHRYDDGISFRKLLRHMFETDFEIVIERDSNRAEDGRELRYRFADDLGYRRVPIELVNSDIYCSILEMMIALAIRCETTIMDDPRVGDRTGQWFWQMIVSLGLGGMTDDRYDKEYTNYVLERFNRREYEPNGKGGLFTIKRCNQDLRDVEIWYQMCWYLDSVD